MFFKRKKYAIKEKGRFLYANGLGCRLVDRLEDASVFTIKEALKLRKGWKNVSIHEVTTDKYRSCALGYADLAS